MTTWDSRMAGWKDRGELPETGAQSHSSRKHSGWYYSQLCDALFPSLP